MSESFSTAPPLSSPEAAAHTADAAASESLRLLEYDKIVARIARLAASEPGRRRVAASRPSTDLATVRDALSRVRETLSIVASGKRLPLGSVRDLEPVLRRLHEENRILEPADLLNVADTLGAARGLRDIVEESAAALPLLSRLVGGIPDLSLLEGKIRAAVDDRGRIRDEASDKLAKLRRELHQLRERVRERLNEIAHASSMRRVLQNATPLLRSGRYVLAVRAEARGGLRGIIHDKSQTGSTVFLEPDEVVEPQNRIQDLSVEEGREETRILLGLSREVLSVEPAVRLTLSICAEADAAFAAAEYARRFGAAIPEVTDKGPLVLLEARHPLLLSYRMESSGVTDPAASGVVPIGLRLGDDFDLLVITGPNTGGKTVALKTVGLLSLMAASGLPVSASVGSSFPLYSRVLADIGDEQSLEQNLSTFSGHVRNLVPIARHADARSLVLVDELGSGTDPAEGAALGASLLEWLAKRRVPTIVTTHIGQLKVFSFREPRAENACVEFDPESLRPTYRLQIGEPGRSNAIEIARRLGFPAGVIERAAELASENSGSADRLMADLEVSRAASERRREETERLLREAADLKKELAARTEEALDREQVLERESDHVVDATLATAGTRVNGLVATLRNEGEVTEGAAKRLEEAIAAELRASPLREKRRAFAQGLKRDDIVYLPRYRNRGTVRKVDKLRESVQVRVGTLDVTVSFDEVSWLEVDRSQKL